MKNCKRTINFFLRNSALYFRFIKFSKKLYFNLYPISLQQPKKKKTQDTPKKKVTKYQQNAR